MTNVNPRELDWSKSGIAWLIERCAEAPKRTLGGKLVKTSGEAGVQNDTAAIR